MSDSDSVSHSTDAEGIAAQVMLQHRLSELEQEKDDLQLMLDMAVEHSDTLLDSLRQENQELMLQLESVANLDEQLQTDRPHTINPFHLVVESLPMGLIIARSVDGHIIYSNPVTCQLLGVSAQELGKRKVTDFFSDSTTGQKIVSAMFNQQIFRGELRWCPSEAAPFEAMVSLHPLMFQDEPAVLTIIQPAISLGQ
ncbi:MAG: PAS domain-containing protein [Cyanobacteria bacterium P01_F01_bin.13]